MTISTTKNKIQYTGDGTTTLFIYDFLVPLASDMLVTVDGAEIASGFTINGAGDPSGGNVTFTVAPVDQVVIVLFRAVPLTQEMDLRPYDAFPADAVEDAFDRLTMMIQDVQELVSRAISASITLPEGTTLVWPDYIAGHGVQWAAEEIQLENTATPLATIVADATAQAQAASVSASSALISEINADDSETRAQEWAENPEDIPVTTGPDKFSALHWAEKAKSAVTDIPIANQIVYTDTPGWGVAEVQAALDHIGANFAVQGASYLKSETYSNSEVYAKGETYSQAEVDTLDAIIVTNATDTAVAMAIALG